MPLNKLLSLSDRDLQETAVLAKKAAGSGKDPKYKPKLDLGKKESAESRSDAEVAKTKRDDKNDDVIEGENVEPIDVISSHYYNSRFNGVKNLASANDPDGLAEDMAVYEESNMDLSYRKGKSGPENGTKESHTATPFDIFCKDLDTFTHFLPPLAPPGNSSSATASDFSSVIPSAASLSMSASTAYPLALAGPIPARLRMSVDHILLRVHVLRLLATNTFAAILRDQQQILKALEQDRSCLPAKLLFTLIEKLMSYDYLRAFALGIKILETFEKSGPVPGIAITASAVSSSNTPSGSPASNARTTGGTTGELPVSFADVSDIAHLLLFPTVYDDEKVYLPGVGSQKGDLEDENVSRGKGPDGAIPDIRSSDNVTTIKAPNSSSSKGRDRLDSKESDRKDKHRNSSISGVANLDIKRRNALENLQHNPKVVMPMLKLE
jgi:hypothetical protein